MEADTFETDVEEAGASGARGNPVQKLSCDQCRQRKVRCDRVDPCGPCSRKAISCTYPAGFKPRAKRQRVLVSSAYDAKLEDISKKLDRICLAVDGIASSPNNSLPSVHADTTAQKRIPPFNSSPFSHSATANDASGSELENDVILTAQATFATDFVQQTVDNHHPLRTLPEVKSSIEALKNMLQVRDSSGRSNVLEPRLVTPSASSDNFQLPPMQLAMAAMQRLREETGLKFLWCLEIESVSQFLEYFMAVYSGKPSIAEILIVHCGLLNLLVACASTETDNDLKSELQSQAVLCRGSLDTFLSNLPFNLPSTFDFALALFMVSTYYLGRCRISLAWTYLSASAQMCISLGYHRDVPLKPETRTSRQRRIRLFWYIHMFDKMLSLRLNRPSSFRDDDITIPFQTCDDVTENGVAPAPPKWVKIGMLQGKIYDDIYSPGALLLPTATRDARARALASGLQDLFLTKDPVEDRFYSVAHMSLDLSHNEVFRRADKVAHLAILTLIYRSIQPDSNSNSAFCNECLSAAHECLQEHKVCLSILRETDSIVLELYVQWALMSAPLVPFIVLFCHTIETRDPSHLESLSAVVEILQLLSPDLLSIYEKQCRLFQLMYDVASKYLNSSEVLEEPYGRKADMPFEMLFTEAGVDVPYQTHTDPHIHGVQGANATGEQFGDLGIGLGGDADMNYGTELGNWFDQNHQIFRMLEDPF